MDLTLVKVFTDDFHCLVWSCRFVNFSFLCFLMDIKLPLYSENTELTLMWHFSRNIFTLYVWTSIPLIEAAIFATAVSVSCKNVVKALILFLHAKFCGQWASAKAAAGKTRQRILLVKQPSFFCLSHFLCTSVSRPQLTYQAVVGGFRQQALFMCFSLSDSVGFHWKTLSVVP